MIVRKYGFYAGVDIMLKSNCSYGQTESDIKKIADVITSDRAARNEKGELLLYSPDGSVETRDEYYRRLGYIDRPVDGWF